MSCTSSTTEMQKEKSLSSSKYLVQLQVHHQMMHAQWAQIRPKIVSLMLKVKADKIERGF